MSNKYKLGEIYEFNDLAKRSLVLIDNCSLQTSTHGYDYSRRCNEFDAQCKADSADFFKKRLNENKGHFFITQCVADEYLKGKDFSLDKRRILLNCFENSNSILDYRDRFAYSLLRGMYGDIVKNPKLHKTDCDLILSALILSMNINKRDDKKICLISNDMSLLSCLSNFRWDNLIAKFPKIKGFVRRDFYEFEMFIPPKKKGFKNRFI